MRRRGGGDMSTAAFPPTPTSQIRAVLQALQSVLDLAAAAETVTLPTTYVRSWREQLQGVLDQLDTAAPLAEDTDRRPGSWEGPLGPRCAEAWPHEVTQLAYFSLDGCSYHLLYFLYYSIIIRQ
jgi:hypothetical protein